MHTGKNVISVNSVKNRFLEVNNYNAIFEFTLEKGLTFDKFVKNTFLRILDCNTISRGKSRGNVIPVFTMFTVVNIVKNSFSRKDMLRKHLAVHTGKKSYHCEHCKTSFSQEIFWIPIFDFTLVKIFTIVIFVKKHFLTIMFYKNISEFT